MWEGHEKETFAKSVKFLRSPERFVSKLVEDLGYDTCHVTKEYDASKCHQDCIKLEKSSFAKNCTKNGGLYKCCIRYHFAKLLFGGKPNLGV